MDSPILSRHRLPQPYRFLMITLWLLPILVFILAVFASTGMSLDLFDPRLLLLLGLMAFPAFYIWQEGLDICTNGIRLRMHLPRYYPYEALQSWSVNEFWSPPVHILVIRDNEKQIVLSWHTAHLTNLSALLNALSTNIKQS